MLDEPHDGCEGNEMSGLDFSPTLRGLEFRTRRSVLKCPSCLHSPGVVRLKSSLAPDGELR